MLGWLKWGSTGVRTTSLATLDDVYRVVDQLMKFTQATADFNTAVAKLPIAQGKLVSVTVDASTLPNFFPHGLSRPFKGVIVVGQSQTPDAILAWDPQTLAANGQDPSTTFMLRCASAMSIDVTAWVF